MFSLNSVVWCENTRLTFYNYSSRCSKASANHKFQERNVYDGNTSGDVIRHKIYHVISPAHDVARYSVYLLHNKRTQEHLYKELCCAIKITQL